MKWEQIQSQSKKVGIKFKNKWSALTDDDLLLLSGSQAVFLARLQERTGLRKEDTDKQFRAFIETIKG